MRGSSNRKEDSANDRLDRRSHLPPEIHELRPVVRADSGISGTSQESPEQSQADSDEREERSPRPQKGPVKLKKSMSAPAGMPSGAPLAMRVHLEGLPR